MPITASHISNTTFPTCIYSKGHKSENEHLQDFLSYNSWKGGSSRKLAHSQSIDKLEKIFSKNLHEFFILTSCKQSPLLVASSCRNCFHELKLSSREPLLIFLKAMAVSVVVTFHPSITLACLNHLSDWVNVIWLPSEPDSPNFEKTSNCNAIENISFRYIILGRR